MIKTILLPLGGGDSDATVLDSAWALAKRLDAHLECLHVKLDSGSAAMFSPHLDFLVGPALHEALLKLNQQGEQRSAMARQHFKAFCERHAIRASERPTGLAEPTAFLREEAGMALDVLVKSARHHDLIVLSRPAGANGLPPDMLEQLLLDSGRPLLIVPNEAGAAMDGVALVFWKESVESAHALAAALPLLQRAREVVLVHFRERDMPGADDGLLAVQTQLSWHGIRATVERCEAVHSAPQLLIEDRVRTHQAGLVVMGGYGHRRSREALFGGWTQSVIVNAGVPVLLSH